MTTPSPPKFQYTRDNDRRRIQIVARETLQGTDLIAIIDRQAQEGTWTFGVLYDLRRTSGATSQADAKLAAAHVREIAAEHGPRGPVALVTRDAGMIAAGHLFRMESASRGYLVEIFWDVDEAEAWLDQRTAG